MGIPDTMELYSTTMQLYRTDFIIVYQLGKPAAAAPAGAGPVNKCFTIKRDLLRRLLRPEMLELLLLWDRADALPKRALLQL